MAGVKRFEDLVCWQLATELEDLVPALLANPKAAADREFCDQILRATAKVAPQIAEGFARFKPRETAYFLRIAKGSLAEVQTHLANARRRNYVPDEQQARAEELARRAIGATTAFLKDRLDAGRQQQKSTNRVIRKTQSTSNPHEPESPEGQP